jgi:hypothetical protein
MKNKKSEPEPLRRGKVFHGKVQEEWKVTAEGNVSTEEPTVKPSGRDGRMDIFVRDDGDKKHVAIAEIKNTNWDVMTDKAVRRNINRQARQIWDYIETQIKKEKEVSTGIIFPKRPKDLERMRFIEKEFAEWGLPVVWEDETKEERKARADKG